MENFKKEIKPDIIGSIFKNQEEFRQKVRAAMEECERGGYEIGSSGFIKSILGAGELSDEDYGECRQVIMTMVRTIEKAGKNTEKRHREKLIYSSEKQQLRENRRAGIHPEDYNEL